MRKVFNFLGYQLVWFAAVLGAARGWTWLGPMAVLLLGSVQLLVSTQRRADARLALLAIAAGFALDGGLSLLDLARYAAASPPWPPAWLLAIWAAFGLTLNHSFVLAQRHLGASALVAAAGGPLAYWSAAQLGAVAFPQPAWRGLAVLALAWSVALPLLASVARGFAHTHHRMEGIRP
ncbi:DUF2878 domain-containing protein [Tahibacter harae]|uniref:DUF2878 domain-containing protein n=1 Tax=Tahibacter harae TaxID=2963937 RepID=A0ABT1QN83_9GAMM|nr:DUF2878 domain-containing protein [Tahibacter harae]MCQ4163505.1 DUF2878 domain-containing protein [Tahibacter harae]